MNGLTPACIKKLVNWDCPNCFKCPYMKQPNDPALPLITNSDRVENYNEDLSEKYNNILHEMKLLNESVLNPCHREAATDDQSPTQHKLDTISENVKLLSEKVIILEKSLETKALSTESVQHPYSKNEDSNEMLPNTVSPHLKPNKITACDAVISYKEEIINSELKKSLLDHVENSEFTVKNTIYYGEYSYKSGDITYPAQKLPKILMELVEAVCPKLSNQNAPINSCIIKRYDKGTKGNPPQRIVEPIQNLLS